MRLLNIRIKSELATYLEILNHWIILANFKRHSIMFQSTQTCFKSSLIKWVKLTLYLIAINQLLKQILKHLKIQELLFLLSKAAVVHHNKRWDCSQFIAHFVTVCFRCPLNKFYGSPFVSAARVCGFPLFCILINFFSCPWTFPSLEILKTNFNSVLVVFIVTSVIRKTETTFVFSFLLLINNMWHMLRNDCMLYLPLFHMSPVRNSVFWMRA